MGRIAKNLTRFLVKLRTKRYNIEKEAQQEETHEFLYRIR